MIFCTIFVVFCGGEDDFANPSRAYLIITVIYI